MAKKDWVPGQGWVERDSSKNAPKKVDDPDSMTADEVEAEGGLGALARKRGRKKNSAGAQGDALLGAKPTPTPRPRPRS